MNGGTRTIRLLLVDDEPAVRRGLKMRFALEPDFEVVGEAGSVAEAISLTQALRPDVILIDVEMAGMDGILAIETLHQAAPHSAVGITLYDDAAMRARAREVGAAALVAKHQTVETLLAAIRRAAVEHVKEEHGDDMRDR